MPHISHEKWFKSRNYIHFDQPVSKSKALKIVSNPTTVAQHNFFPLLHYKISTHKIKNNNGVITKKIKTRDIYYASHLDSHIYSYYAYQLSMFYEKKIKTYQLDKNILAFRSLGKSNIEFANDVFEDIKARGNCCVLAFDITGFFDNLDHKILKQSWIEVLDQTKLPKDHFQIYKSLTKYCWVDRDKAYSASNISKNNPKPKNKRLCSTKEFRNTIRKGGLLNIHTGMKGIPQGTPISAILSNIYMLNFDQGIKKLTKGLGISYYRYCDDLLFIVNQNNQKIIEFIVDQEIAKISLNLNPNKTNKSIFRVQDGKLQSDIPVQYLGFTFDGQRKLIRASTLARFSNKVTKGVKLAKATKKKRDRLKRKKGHTVSNRLYKKKLYSRYSYLGKRNFITYAHRSAETMNSKNIKKQIKPLWKRLQKEIL